MVRIIKEYSGCTLKFDDKIGTLIQVWNEEIKSYEFRKVISDSLHFFQENKSANSIISDTRKQAILGSGDLNWVLANINPQLSRNGCRKMAFITSDSIIIRSETARFEKFTGDNMEMASFRTMESAVDWISKQSEES